MIRRDLHQRNRLAWDAATRAHSSHKSDMAGFLGAGGTTLFDEEVRLLLGREGASLDAIRAAGERPLAGLRLLHAPCNAGQDTLSLALLGAEVVGVDISVVAISEAQALSRAAGIPATFHRADLFDWLPAAAAAGERFDLAFMSYGVLLWMSDLAAFVAGMAALNKDVPPYVMAAGHYAKPFGVNSEGLKRRGYTPEQIAAIKRAYKMVFRQDLTIEQAIEAIESAAQADEANAQVMRLMSDFLKTADRGIIR